MRRRAGTEVVCVLLVSTPPPPPLGRSPLLQRPVAPVDAIDVVDRFFDALGHFEGETPALADLADVLADDAEIVVGTDDEADTHYSRADWLCHLSDASSQNELPAQGHFFEEIERTLTDCAPDVRVGSVVQERRTRGDHVAVVEVIRCALVVGCVDGSAKIVQVNVRRSSRPPPP